MLIQPGSPQVVANQANLPQRNFVGFQIKADAGNDVIIATTQDYDVIDNEFLLESGSSGHILTNGENRVDLISGPSSSPFEFFDFEALHHFVNDTADELEFSFQADFYDLLKLNGEDLNNTNLIEDVLLFDKEYHGLKFNVPEDEVMMPLVFSANAQTEVDPFRMRTILTTPSGFRQDVTFELSPFEEGLLPFVPFESGEYTLFLEPRDGDVILDHFAILNDFPVQDIENGCIKRLQGTRADVDFFRPLILIDPGQSTESSSEFSTDLVRAGSPPNSLFDLRVDGFVHQDNIIQDLNRPNDLLGNAMIRVHTPDSPFGSLVPRHIFDNDNTVISTTVFPPDDENPSIKAEKVELGLEEGYDLEIGFWFEINGIPNLPIEENILLNNGNSDWFTFTLNNTMIIGLNDSLTNEFSGGIQTFALFTNLLTGDQITIDARTHDISNFNNVKLQMLPAGNYAVSFFASPNSFAQISLFNYQILDVGATTVTQNLGENRFFSLPSNDFFIGMLNFTATSLTNMSSFFDVFIYDSSGEQLNDDNFGFENYGNLLNTTFVTSINDSIIGGVNTRGAYLQVRYTGNTMWNTSQLVPSALESDVDLSTTLNIDRMSYLANLQLNPNEDHQTCDYNNFSETALNGSLNQIVRYCDYQSSIGGNRLLISGINMSMNVEVFVDGSNQWFNKASSSRTANGVTEYSVLIEFATLEPVNFIVIIGFVPDSNGISFNNSISVTSQITPINYLPEVVLRTFKLTGIGSDGELPITISTSGTGTSPFSIGETVAVTTAIAGGAGLIFYVVQVRGFRPNLRRFRKV